MKDNIPATTEIQGPCWSFEIKPDRNGVQLRSLDSSKPDEGAQVLDVPMGSIFVFEKTGRSAVVKQMFILGMGNGVSRTEFRLFDIGPDGKEIGTSSLIGSIEPARIV